MTEPQPKPVASQPVDDDNHNQLDDSENAASAELSGPQGAQGTQGTQGEPAPEAGPETGQAAAAHGQSDAPGPSPELNRPELNRPELGRPELGRDSSDQLSASQSDDDFPDDLGDDTADDAAPLGNGPRLDRVSAHPADNTGTLPRRRTVDLAVDEDDEDDATFGPKLAAWLQAYRARQAANGNGPAQPVRVLPAQTPATGMAAPHAQPQAVQPQGPQMGQPQMGRPTGQLVAGQATAGQPMAGQPMATQPMTGPASAAWAGRAQVAFDEMLATSPPPEWVAARREREMRGRSGANWLLVASIALLMAGTATVAFVAAARNAGVDPSLGTVVAALNPPAATRPAPVVIVEPTLPKQDAQTAVTAQSQPAPKAAAQTPSAPAAVVPRVEIVDTRVIAPAIAAAIPALPAAPIPAPQAAPAPVVAELPSEPVRRSTLLLPTETRSSETPLVDHPQATAAPQAPASVRVSPQAVEAAIVEASTREPRQAGATPPESPPEVRVASLNPGIELIRPGPASEAASSERSATAPSVNGLTHRAGLLLETGDVVAARMLFELAARGGDAAAAVGAGLTYDPVQFERLGVRGIQPDAELARAWYQRALDGGEKGALGEIERLEAWLAR